MKFKPYAPEVELLWATPDPASQVHRACSNTMRGKFVEKGPINKDLFKPLMNYLVDADHTNPFGHISISFRLKNISRACADQIVRHTTINWTMSSTHYQNHSEYGGFAALEMVIRLPEYDTDYSTLAFEYGHDEARQVLPLATEVSLIATGNMRAWLNFFDKRMCLRNTMETVLLANLLAEHICAWFPEISERVGPKCFYTKCNQGKMACNKTFMQGRLMSYQSGASYAKKYS